MITKSFAYNRPLCTSISRLTFAKKQSENNNLKMKTSMKNMYLAAAMAVSLAFTACSDDESGQFL